MSGKDTGNMIVKEEIERMKEILYWNTAVFLQPQ